MSNEACDHNCVPCRLMWLPTEFNTLDDDGLALVLIEDAPQMPALNDQVTLYDDEGNRCPATIVAIEDRLIRAEPDWDKWRAAEPPIEHGTVVAPLGRPQLIAAHRTGGRLR